MSPSGDARPWYQQWDNYFFKPRDTIVCSIVRIAFALVLVPYLLILGLDLETLFGETGVLPYAQSRVLVDSDVLSPLGWLAPSNTALWFCYWLFVFQVICLLLGISSRFQAIAVLFWLMAFQHRNNLTIDGGDTQARLTAFYLFCMSCGERLSIDGWLRRRKGFAVRLLPVWGLRLLQIQMILLYLSTALLKAGGEDWLNGSALIYITQLHDVFGRFPLPNFLLQSIPLLKAITWGVLIVEILIPFGLWFSKTRSFTVVLAIAFHLALDYSMNLFLFQWFMIVWLLSFMTLDSIPLKYFSRWLNSSEKVRLV